MAILSTLSFTSLSPIFTWQILALMLLLWNLKTLPCVWHLRLIYHFVRNWSQKMDVKRTLLTYDGQEHPLFAPVSIWSRSPILEIDYNLHKSNSTFFSDLDMSRTALFIRTFSAGYRPGFRELQAEGKPGQLRPILGSVHCSFKKEIRAYEKYEVRSRILGWDAKWLIIASWFVLPARKGQSEELCASALSKYVIKKGRITVKPELALKISGWLPPKPADAVEREDNGLAQNQVASQSEQRPLKSILRNRSSASSETDIRKPVGHPDGHRPESPDGDSVLRWDMEPVSLKGDGGSPSGPKTRPNKPSSDPQKGRKWDWHRVEQERHRGVLMARGWLDLDQTLMEEYSRWGT